MGNHPSSDKTLAVHLAGRMAKISLPFIMCKIHVVDRDQDFSKDPVASVQYGIYAI